MTEISGFYQGTGMPDSDWWESLWPNPENILTMVGIKPDMELIDLCSGDGWFTLPMARIAHKVTAIDIDAKLLERARLRPESKDIKNCDYIEGNAYDVADLVKSPVDFVFLANSFHGVPDKSRLSCAVKKALKPDGLFVIINWHARPREKTTVFDQPRGPATELRITPEATISKVETSGLKLRTLVEVSPYHYAAIFQNSI